MFWDLFIVELVSNEWDNRCGLQFFGVKVVFGSLVYVKAFAEWFLFCSSKRPSNLRPRSSVKHIASFMFVLSQR